MTPYWTSTSTLAGWSLALLVLASGCRTPPKPGEDGLDGSEGTDSGLLEDLATPDDGEDGTDTGSDDTGGDDSGGDDSGGDDSGGDDSGGDDGGGSGDDGGGSGDGGGSDGGDSGGEGSGDSSGDPDELCNGIDDDGDGLIDEGDACPDVVVTDPDTGGTYLVVEEAMMWFDAAAYCVSYGYTLATIDDEAENAFIWELIYDGEDGVHTVNAHTWIGLHEDLGMAWEWHDGTATGGYDASSGDVVTDDYGTVTFGQAMAFGDEDTYTWFEAPQTWYHHAVCEAP